MSHAHDHGAHTAEAYDYAAANQQHFDKEAKSLDMLAYVLEHAQKLTKVMVERYPTLFDKEKTTLLDFACGTGAPLQPPFWFFRWTDEPRWCRRTFQGVMLPCQVHCWG